MQSRAALKEKIYKRLLAEEEARVNGPDNPWALQIQFSDTASLAEKYRQAIEPGIDGKIFGPGLMIKAGILGMVLFILFVVGMITYSINTSIPAGIGKLILWIASAAILVAGAFRLIMSRFSKRRIALSTSSLILDEKEYLWNEMLGTYILKRTGKNDHYTLVLILEDQRVIMYPLDVYNTLPPERFPGKLSAYIEHFRNKNND